MARILSLWRYWKNSAETTPLLPLLAIEAITAPPSRAKITEIVLEEGNPKALKILISRTSVKITAKKIVMISEKKKSLVLKIPPLAISNIPSDSNAPRIIPVPAIPKTSQTGNNLDVNTELRDFNPSALKLTTRSKTARTNIKIRRNKYIFSMYFQPLIIITKLFLIPL
jgi:hypothetical protein